MALSPPPVSAEHRARLALLGASVVSMVGIVAAGTTIHAARTAGGVLLCAGWLLFAYALHSFGRAGSERE